MADEHPLEQLLRDAKQKDDAKAVALATEQREALDLQDKARSQWGRTKVGLDEEIQRANAILEKHNLPERYALRELSETGPANIARCNLALATLPSLRAPSTTSLSWLLTDVSFCFTAQLGRGTISPPSLPHPRKIGRPS